MSRHDCGHSLFLSNIAVVVLHSWPNWEMYTVDDQEQLTAVYITDPAVQSTWGEQCRMPDSGALNVSILVSTTMR